MKQCRHCHKVMCGCERNKWKAEIVYTFSGKTPFEANRGLKQFKQAISVIDNGKLGFRMASYPGAATLNQYAQGTENEIVQLVATLINKWCYDDVQLTKFLKDLKDKTEELAEEEVRWE